MSANTTDQQQQLSTYLTRQASATEAFNTAIRETTVYA